MRSTLSILEAPVIPARVNGGRTSPSLSSSVPISIQPNDWIEVKDDIPLIVQIFQDLSEEKLIPAGSILQVTERREADKDVQWLQLKVCSVGNYGKPATKPTVTPGDISRLLEARVKQNIRDNIIQFLPSDSKLSAAQLGECLRG